MKKILSIGFVLMIAIGLTACGETKEEKIVNNIIDITEKAGEKVDDQTKEILNNVVKNSPEFQKQIANEMAQMPSTLKVAKFYRDCLSDAEDKEDAIECYNDADKMAQDLGLPEDPEEFNADEEFGNWSEETRQQFISEMDNDLKLMEQFMK
jgi:hypothetical protein